MKHTSLIAAVLLLAACSSISSGIEQSKMAPSNFRFMKSLVGTWTGTADGGGESHPVTTTFRLTAGGSTVVETMLEGSEHEMISMYHLDHGDMRLMQTHYCSAGNQPRMVAVESDVNSISFRFLDMTGASEDAEHMHEMRIEKKDADHLEEWWTAWKDGKADHTAHFVLTRKK